jgi:chromosome segregation ATPase
MFKKILVVGAVGLLAAAVLTQTKVGSYLSHQWNRAERHMESKIPPEEEIERIKGEVASLDKDINKAKGSLAEENVEVRYLGKRVADLRVVTEKSRSAVEARGRTLKDAGDSKLVKWENQSIDVNKAKERLASEVANHKALEKEFKAKETMLAVREQTRIMAEQHLQALITQKSELETAVVEIEALIKQAKVEQVQSKFQNDGTRMAQVKEDLAKLRKRIDIQREKLHLSKNLDRSSVENRSVDEILADLDTKSEASSDLVNKK